VNSFRRSLRGRFSLLASAFLVASSLLSSLPAYAGGTPDPSNIALTTTNRNSLVGILGPDRGFGFGDYVTDRVSGLQRGGAVATYDYYIEVPPGQTSLVVQIFDAEVGGGDNLGTPGVNEDLHDQDNTTAGWVMTTTYQLFDPSGASVASLSLVGQDCDPVTAGIQTACDNVWSDLGAFTVANPAPGHWRMAVGSPNSGNPDEDDYNAYGIRANDGDASAGGNEFPIYALTYVGIGQVYAATAGADPGFSSVTDFFPYVRRDCTCESNDWDSDSAAPIDESTVFTTRTGATPTGSNGTLSMGTVWRQNVLSGFTTAQSATDYGLWRLRWTTGRFNFIGFYMGDETNFDPSNAAPGPGNGQEPNQQPEAGSIRLYLPADGSRLFGLAGGANDVIVPPLKPWVGQSWALLPGQPPIEANVTSIARVTITVANPSAYPIQFSNAVGGPNVLVGTLPNNAGQTTYVPGSATITGGSSTATSVSGIGPWTITFAPGVIAAGVTATLTFDVSITPTPAGLPKTLFLTGTSINATGTAGSYIDETCADAGGGATVCGATALANANLAVGPLCQLSTPVTSAPAVGVAKQVNGSVVDNGNGTFTVPFRVIVENLGTTTLAPLQVVDNLALTFPAPAAVIGVTAPVTSIIGGVGVLTANAGYNGVGDTNLLTAASSSLNVGAVGQIDFSVTFDPNGLPGPFFNQAFVSGTTPLGGTVTDASDNGLDPDPNGNGNADEPGENDPTPVPINEAPVIGVAKAVAGAVTNNGNGTFTVNFDLRVENLGNVDLTTVQVTDNLLTTFPAPVSIVSVSAVSASIFSGTGAMTANGAYNGVGNTNLLTAASSNLTVGAVGQITFSVTFDPNGQAGPFNNQATASALSPQGTTVTDLSDNGLDPDPNGNGDPDEPGENDPTPIGVPEVPVIGVAKRVNGPIADNGNGTFTVNFVLVVENLGNVALSSVTVADDLSATFPAPVSITNVTAPIASITTGSGAMNANAGYNGVGDTQLLLSSSSLAVASTGQISFSVTFNPNGQAGPFNNQALASGMSPGDVIVTDLSDDGADPDPDGDGNPDEPGENDPTPVTVPNTSVSSIGIAKYATGLIDNGDSTYTVTIVLTVENLGNLAFQTVQVTDDLALTFPAPASVVSVTAPVTSIVSGTGVLTANAIYDGTGDIDLLVAGSSSLDSGAVGQIEFDVTFDPADLTSFLNSALVSATNTQGTVTDTSDDGTEPDADGDGNADEPGENDPTPITLGGPIVEVPVLDLRGLLLLSVLLGAAGYALLRRS